MRLAADIYEIRKGMGYAVTQTISIGVMINMRTKVYPIIAAALLLTACGSEKIESRDPADITAATRVAPPENEVAQMFSSSEESSEEEKPKEGKVNEYGLHDQYFRDSMTNKFNELIAQRNFVSDVNYYEEREDGKWLFWYNERNEINGNDRHQQTLDDPNSGIFTKDMYYLKDTAQHYCAYALNWDDFTYSVQLDVDADYENKLLEQTLASTLFYGIDDLETAVYMGYSTDPETGLTLEQFMIEDVVYSFTYDANGILKDSRGDGHRVKVRSFETSCPTITIPKMFKFKE